MSPQIYKFADFTFDTDEGLLRKKGKPLALNPKAAQVLTLLLENAGNLIRKEEFFEKVWAESFVEDNNLTVSIAAIRKALGETKTDKFIETVPKKGYRFVGAVESEQSASSPGIFAEPAAPPVEKRGKGFFALLASRKILVFAGFVLVIFSIGAIWKSRAKKTPSKPFQSIAVLPFSAEKTSPDTEILVEKLTQELIYNLGRITEVRLSGYDAVSLYLSPEADLMTVGKDLQVDGVVTGKIKNNGEAGELEIKVKDLRTDEFVFTNSYPLTPQALADSQYLIARDLARELGAIKEQKNQTATTNFEAYQNYLLARHHLGKRSTKDYEKAIEFFTEAVLKDASFADAHAGLAVAHIQHGLSLYANRGLAASRKSFPAAKESALRALELESDSSEALAALAFVDYRHEYDWKNAEANFKRSVELNPNNVQTRRWFGEFLHCAGRFDEGFTEQRAALKLEPNSARILSEIAWGNYLAHRFDKAVDYSQKSFYIDKTHAATLYNLSEIYEQKGNFEESVALWKEAMTIEAAARRWIANLEKSFQKDGAKGFAKAKAEWLEDLIEKDYVYPTDLAKARAALGDRDKALDWLKKGVEARVPDILSIKYAPAFDSLKDDPRFQALLKQMNFQR